MGGGVSHREKDEGPRRVGFLGAANSLPTSWDLGKHCKLPQPEI